MGNLKCLQSLAEKLLTPRTYDGELCGKGLIGMELSYREISKNLCLSLGTAHNHFKHFELTGDVAAKSSNRALSITLILDIQPGHGFDSVCSEWPKRVGAKTCVAGWW